MGEENYQPFYRNPWNIPQINKEKPNKHNMQLVGFGKTGILTDYVPKSPWTLGKLSSVSVEWRAEIGKQFFFTLLDNFNAYIRGIYREFEFNLLERHPIPVEIITQPSSRNKRNLKAWKNVIVIKDLIV